jgi:hypothetical protein
MKLSLRLHTAPVHLMPPVAFHLPGVVARRGGSTLKGYSVLRPQYREWASMAASILSRIEDGSGPPGLPTGAVPRTLTAEAFAR